MVLAKKSRANWLRVAVHVAALVPLVLLGWDYARDQLSADWIREITLRTGRPALVLLVLSLACTPVYIVTGFKPAVRLRKPLGLYAFLYACLHLFIFVGLDYGFDLSLSGQQILEKRFVQAGLVSLLIMIPLAATSTKGATKRLGKNWRRLHRLVYLAALAAVVHFVWLVKSDVRRPLLYGVIVLLLLAIRIPVVRDALTRTRNRLRKSKDRTAS